MCARFRRILLNSEICVHAPPIKYSNLMAVNAYFDMVIIETDT